MKTIHMNHDMIVVMQIINAACGWYGFGLF